MERVSKVTVSLSQKLSDMLDELSDERGMKRTLIMQMALEKFYWLEKKERRDDA